MSRASIRFQPFLREPHSTRARVGQLGLTASHGHLHEVLHDTLIRLTDARLTWRVTSSTHRNINRPSRLLSAVATKPDCDAHANIGILHLSDHAQWARATDVQALVIFSVWWRASFHINRANKEKPGDECRRAWTCRRCYARGERSFIEEHVTCVPPGGRVAYQGPCERRQSQTFSAQAFSLASAILSQCRSLKSEASSAAPPVGPGIKVGPNRSTGLATPSSGLQTVSGSVA